jgi:hypothetical protein
MRQFNEFPLIKIGIRTALIFLIIAFAIGFFVCDRFYTDDTNGVETSMYAHYTIVISNYPHCYIDGEEVDVKAFQESLLEFVDIKVDNMMGWETAKAAMFANSVIEFDATY